MYTSTNILCTSCMESKFCSGHLHWQADLKECWFFASSQPHIPLNAKSQVFPHTYKSLVCKCKDSRVILNL